MECVHVYGEFLERAFYHNTNTDPGLLVLYDKCRCCVLNYMKYNDMQGWQKAGQ